MRVLYKQTNAIYTCTCTHYMRVQTCLQCTHTCTCTIFTYKALHPNMLIYKLKLYKEEGLEINIEIRSIRE